MEMTNETYTMNEMYRLGMEYLVEKFGIVNTELFITAVKTENDTVRPLTIQPIIPPAYW